jgi:2-dehydro-3-deoxyphosphogluconate aldolase/(4S)-4-hydroxy-2-oxoglutarate aldolase
MPSGGVALDNAKDWFAHGAVAIGVGSSLTGPGNEGDFAGVTERARQFMHLVKTIPNPMM